MPGPLSGVRVLDLTGVVSGPFATMFLADQGADVLKIEPIGGDITRRSRAPIHKDRVFTAQAVAAALYAREKTGQGDHIQVAMLDAMISYLWPEGMMQYTVVGAEATAADPNDRPDLVFKTSDGYITAGTISDSEWQGFCRASGDPELAKDPRFATPSARSVNATARINKMGEYIAQRTTAEWLERLDAADVPCAPILRRGEIIHNEQVVARDIIAEFDQPMVGRVRQPKPAARFA